MEIQENKKFTGILLAAGMGLRLGEITKDKPKALIEINEKPLFSYAIDFLRAVGAEKIIVVGGFGFDNLKKAVEDYDDKIKIIRNWEYKKGNLYSLESALFFIDGSFLLCNTDHIYKLPIRDKVKNQLNNITAFCDFDRNLHEDDMKVLCENFQLKEISKKLTNFNAGYVGLTYCDKECFVDYKEAFNKVKTKYGENAVVENVLAELAFSGKNVKIGDISGYGWLEIDFPEEMKHAELDINQNPKNYIKNDKFYEAF